MNNSCVLFSLFQTIWIWVRLVVFETRDLELWNIGRRAQSTMKKIRTCTECTLCDWMWNEKCFLFHFFFRSKLWTMNCEMRMSISTTLCTCIVYGLLRKPLYYRTNTKWRKKHKQFFNWNSFSETWSEQIQ